MENLQYHANGKLLLTGEYVVMHGALALALPCQFGQSLILDTQADGNTLHWKSFDYKESVWFEAVFDTNLVILSASERSVAETLQKLLQYAASKNPDFSLGGKRIEVFLEFPRDWGLGSSSTLVVLVSQVFDVSPFELQFAVFGGSGYDIACAVVAQPIFYQLVDQKPEITKVDFQPVFRDKLLFVHQNKKQNSRHAIESFRAKVASRSIEPEMTRISEITTAICTNADYDVFRELLWEHEKIIGSLIQTPPIQKEFPDFQGTLKSLGAWGGDFMLVAGKDTIEKNIAYFKQKGFQTVIKYDDMVEGLPIAF